MGENSLPGLGPVTLMKRPVRTPMQGVVWAGGLLPQASRLGRILKFKNVDGKSTQNVITSHSSIWFDRLIAQ